MEQETIDLENANVFDFEYFNKPSLLLRIKSMIIDSVIIVLLMFISFLILDALEIGSGLVRGVFLVLIFLYEPLMTSFNRTVGQKFMGLRVRKMNSIKRESVYQNINLGQSMLRYFGKVFLGWISLLTIHSNEFGRAIHDIMGMSVMTMEK